MAVGKEIKKKIGSVQNTLKITSAMQMVAASKMRRTQDRMQQGKPYSERIRGVISHLANSNPEYKHIYMQEREIKLGPFRIVVSVVFKLFQPFGRGCEESGINLGKLVCFAT